MELSYKRILEIFALFNIVALTEADFWREAKRNKIVVRHEPLLVDGYYEKKKGRHYIVINSSLQGVRWLHTAFHELFHFFLDAPMDDEDIKLFRSRIQIKTSREKIADALALIAVLPFPELEKLVKEDLTDNPYLMDLVRDRIAVLAEKHK